MKLATLFTLFLLASFTGCAPSTVTVPTENGPALVPVKQLTEVQKISLLRAEAHKRNLKWHIVCIDWSSAPQSQFLGVATVRDGNLSAQYIEDGDRGTWIKTGPTQAETAYALYLDILGPMSHPARHRPLEPTRSSKKMCPPELRGE